MTKPARKDPDKAEEASIRPVAGRSEADSDLDPAPESAPPTGTGGDLVPAFGPGQPRNYCGKAGRSGPPAGNRNNMRHGLKAGQLPKDAKYIEHRLNAFRRQLEDAVMDCKGSVSLTDAAAIQTCLRWERHAYLAQRWLVKAGEKLKLNERLNFSREIARASTERDKALAALELDRDTVQDAWADLDATPASDLEDK